MGEGCGVERGEGVGQMGGIEGMARRGLRELSKIYQNPFPNSVFAFSLLLPFASPPLFPAFPHPSPTVSSGLNGNGVDGYMTPSQYTTQLGKIVN